MSVRYCIWPDCPARFPIAQGPIAPGWWLARTGGIPIALCGFHSRYRHVPLLFRHGTRLSRMICSCQGLDINVDSWAEALRRWRHHIRAHPDTCPTASSGV